MQERKSDSLTGVCITMYVWVDTQVNCEICLESTGLHELFGWLCVVLQKMPQNDDLSRQETIGQRFPMNCSKIDHSMYEAFTYLFGWNIFFRLLSANKNYPVDLLKLAITVKFVLFRDSGTQTINSNGTLMRSRREDFKTLRGFLLT